MVIRIDDRIVDCEVIKPSQKGMAGGTAQVQQLDEHLQRPEALEGATYKIKTPLSEHALYVTINDVVLNPGTALEQRRPFEIFINSKNMDHFQWIVALTRIISAVFRKGGDCTFLAEELRSVFDPKGGYFKKGGKFMPSLVAEIGDVIELHLRKIGLLETERLDPQQRDFIAAQRAELQLPAGMYPNTAQLCGNCHTKAMVPMGGCMTCLNCGESSCG